MKSELLGDNMQALVVKLDAGENMFAEAGSMMYMKGAVDMDAEMTGGLMGGIKRVFIGESLFFTTYKATGEAEVAFASPYPGKIKEIEIDGNSLLCQRDAFLVAQEGVEVEIALSKRLGAGFFGGEGFILQELKGKGTTFIHAGGNFVEMDLKKGEELRVDTGCLVAFDSSVAYDIKFVGGIKKSIFGGEGLFYALLNGPGKVYLQTLPFSRLADKVLDAAGGNTGEKRGIRTGDIIGDMFGK